MPQVNLAAPSVAVREIRLNTITGYAGTAADIVSRSRGDAVHGNGTAQDAGCTGHGDGTGRGCATGAGGRGAALTEKSRSFSQCLGCSTSNAACMVTLVQDGAVISHGPVGCSTCLHEFAFTYRVNAPLRGIEKPTQRHVYSTNLSEDETVFGGTDKLTATIHEVYERDRPSVIFIITTCASGIIGDDVEGAANDAQEELGIPVVAIFCEGFRSKVWTSGFDAAYHGVARKLIEPARPPEQRLDAQGRAQKPFVNVINFWGSDVFTPWFERFGARANYITPYSTLETLRRSSEALASVQICTTLGSYLTGALEQVYDVPALRAAPPYGVVGTDRWLRSLGELFGQPEVAEELIAEGH
ncbi:MAG: hypothetical protein LBP24_04050, partial [Coriobacteriales bacterium]|nr:hypothetical protein [Coriobacteriales bacterium]